MTEPTEPKEETLPKAEEPLPVVEPDDKIERANAAAKRMEDANKRHEELLIQQERIAVNDRLGGRSEVSEKETEADKQKKASRALIPQALWKDAGLE